MFHLFINLKIVGRKFNQNLINIVVQTALEKLGATFIIADLHHTRVK